VKALSNWNEKQNQTFKINPELKAKDIMKAFGFTTNSYIKISGSHEDNFIVVQTLLTDRLWERRRQKPVDNPSLDSLVGIFKEAEEPGGFFSTAEKDQRPTSNVLVLTPEKLFQQLKRSKVRVVNIDDKVDNDYDSNGSDEDSVAGENESDDEMSIGNTKDAWGDADIDNNGDTEDISKNEDDNKDDASTTARFPSPRD